MSKHQRNTNQFTGLSVTLRDGEPVEKALRRLKKKVVESKIMETLREKESYTSPSEKRKRAKAAARARWLKQLRKNELQPQKRR